MGTNLKELVGVVGAGLPLGRVDEMRRQNVVQVGVVAAHPQPGEHARRTVQFLLHIAILLRGLPTIVSSFSAK